MSALERTAEQTQEPAKADQASADKMWDDAFQRLKDNALKTFEQRGTGTYLPDYLSQPSPWRIPGGTETLPNFPKAPADGRKKEPLPDPSGGKIPETGGPGTDIKPLPKGPVIPNPGDILRTDPATESTAQKISREAMVIGGGIGQSFFYGVANLPDHIPQIASSVVVGGTLAAMSKTGKLGAGAALVVGAYFTSRFILDTLHDGKRWQKFSDAVKDTWQTDANFWKNMHTVRDTAGNYTFDTSLSLASGYVGYKNPQLGEMILAILRVPPIVPNAPPPFNPRLATTSMYMAIMPPAGFYRDYDDQTPFSSSSWKFDIHGSVRRIPDGITRTPYLMNQEREEDRNQIDPREHYYRQKLQKGN